MDNESMSSSHNPNYSNKNNLFNLILLYLYEHLI